MTEAATGHLALTALDGIPSIEAGDDLAAIIAAALDGGGHRLEEGDVLVVAQKIVSKAEGRTVALGSVSPGAEALELARATDKDPRVVELILAESEEVVRQRPGLVIVRHHLGMVMANAGIDASNTETPDSVILLPENPDASAKTLRNDLHRHTGVAAGIVINDSVGRPWRIGTVGIALGVAGLAAVVDLRDQPDRAGRLLLVSEQAIADEISAAANLLQGQAAEGRPVILIRGLPSAMQAAPAQNARSLLRPDKENLFP